jgi:serine protease
MKNRSIAVWSATALILAAPTFLNAADTSRVYVKFKSGQKNVARGLIQQAGGKIHHEFDSLNAVATTVPAAALASIRNNSNVVSVEDDPPRYLLGCEMPVEQIPYGIDAVQATALWDANHDGILDVGTRTGSGIKIGIIDSGVFSGHSDFAGVTMTGYADPGFDWQLDTVGHGTHVTGTIVAQLNGSGVVGVSPGVSIYALKVFEYYYDPDPFTEGVYWIYSSTLLDAAQKCQAAGCKIINMSLGGAAPSQTENDGFAQLYNAGVLLVASAGNAGDTSVSYPAGYASVISVAAVDQNNNVAGFSQRNGDVELAAPGVNVVSTVPYCVVNSVSGNGFEYPGNPIDLAALGGATGVLVDGGLGDTINPAWAGKVVLVQRGSITYYEKVMNVQNSGGLACVIFNNMPGDLYGTLSQGPSLIPAIGVSQENGQALLARLNQIVTVHTGAYTEVSAWDTYSGTSMAAPHVCAAAALIWSSDPTKSNSQVRQSLRETALDLGIAGRDIATGFGLVQAKAAMEYLPTATGEIDDGDVGDTIPPVISNVRSLVANAKKGTFSINWNTDEPATTVVILNGVTYTDSSLVTSHSQTFRGRKRRTYTYYVRSTDAAGNASTAGPFTHQN